MAHERLRPQFLFDEEKIKQLKQLAPESFEDGKINFETLRQNLGDWAQDEEDKDLEHFGLFWPGKRDARRIASMPPQGTLEPVYGEGLKADGTPDKDGVNDSKNIFIEGENLEVLKILQKSYAGKIKMIYIDPPYNTGNDFVYDDDFTEPLQEYLRRTGQVDEEGKPLTTNKRSDGRFHSKWLSMMYPRLRLARNLLREDGVIFISIDDNEIHNLRAICNEIFGEENFLAQLVWRTDGNFDNQAKFKKCHEYILVFAKDEIQFQSPPIIDPNVPKTSKLYNEEIRNTIVKNGPKNPPSDITLPKGFPCEMENGIIEKGTDQWPHFKNKCTIKNFSLEKELVAFSGWSSKDLILEFINNNCQPIVDSKGQKTSFIISKSQAIEVVKLRSDNQSHVISVLSNLGNTQSTSARLRESDIIFDYPKPTQLIEYLIRMNHGDSFIVLDFFAGSNTTAEAVYNVNSVDKKKIKFITVQLPEPIESGVAFEKGFKKISQISLKRVKESSKNSESFDKGVKFYALRKSNFKIWSSFSGTSIEELQNSIDLFNQQPLVNNWKEDGLISELLLLEGFVLSHDFENLKVYKSNRTFKVMDGFCEHSLLICLDKEIKKETIQSLELSGNDIFICLDSAISNVDKLRLSDKGLIKTI